MDHISAVTVAVLDMPQSVTFYRALHALRRAPTIKPPHEEEPS
jgi:hypothetical protein